jgi:hypothetical protein
MGEGTEIMASRRTLFSVIEVISNDGEKSFEVEWHPEMYPFLDEAYANGQMTDRLIELAEELLQPIEV